MNSLWLVPLAVGAAGAVALGVVGRRLAAELETLRQALKPLRPPVAATPLRIRSRG